MKRNHTEILGLLEVVLAQLDNAETRQRLAECAFDASPQSARLRVVSENWSRCT